MIIVYLEEKDSFLNPELYIQIVNSFSDDRTRFLCVGLIRLLYYQLNLFILVVMHLIY